MKITIFGFAGSGTSTIGKILAEKLNYKFMSSGNIMRNWASEKNLSIEEFENKIIKNDGSFDLKLDKKVKNFGLKNQNFILESRLAWFFILDSFKIFLKCDKQIRYERILERENGNFSKIKLKTEKREKELVLRYNKLYSKIQFPPKDKNFDLIIDTTNLSIDKIVEKIKVEIK